MGFSPYGKNKCVLPDVSIVDWAVSDNMFPTGAIGNDSGIFGTDLDHFLTEVECDGTEPTLRDCTHLKNHQVHGSKKLLEVVL